MKKLLSFVGLLALGSAAWWLFQTHLSAPHAAAADVSQKNAVPILAASVERQDTPAVISAIGTAQAYNSVTVRTRVDGQLDKVAFVEGQEVHRGDLLAQLDSRPFEAQLRSALAQKDRDAAQLANVERDLARFSDLAHRGAIPAQTLDTTRAQVDQLKATVEMDQAQIENARIALGYTTIRAPLDGRTGARLVDAGNMVHATDSNGLVLITQVHPITVSFSLPQDELPALLASQRKAALQVTALSRDASQQLGQGVISLIDNQIDSTTGTIHCKATFDNATNLLWPGQFVVLHVVLDMHRDALTVPATAVQLGTDGTYVFIVTSKGTADLRHVEVAFTEANRSVIARGVSQGERVVTEGQYHLEPGTPVRIIDRPPSLK
ncbi:efflux RND transporter periplasmic adaptor subunit [Dyella tabacisoli]|uniref:Efflux RND transporter periplasmic adaptor subunit n=1 Tax=Dyella tabacisoli TaxID=2282381 RepID=A0A369UN67_9GAMM|nr:efflux RND transporter periplasmic adaptor subunit [Dyella tabacisoli]RDD81971.1 efflux RND transporter periplasmic adaptor subunit [Dyella tabacisoli]